MNIVIIDNYDSFTYNLAHAFRSLGCKVSVLRNDRFALPDLDAFDKIVLSPGPGIPSEAGLTMDVIRHYASKKPILGVCLGHQAIGEVFGGKLVNLSQVYHGVATPIAQCASDPLFATLPSTFTVGRYHSWVVDATAFPDCLEITARSEEGLVMALRHKDYDLCGIQFHPESVLTPEGLVMLGNWVYLDVRTMQGERIAYTQSARL